MSAIEGLLGTALDTASLTARWAAMRLSSRSGALCSRAALPRSVVLLASDFAPELSGGIYRPAALVRRLVERGWHTQVVTGPAPVAPDPSGVQVLERIPAQVRVNRIPAARLRASARWSPQVHGGAESAVAFYETAARLYQRERPEFIIASGPNFAVFIAGLHLAQRLRARLIVEYRDEWTECPIACVRPRADDRPWEARSLRACDAAIFTTRTQLEHQAAVFGCENKPNWFVAPNGFEPADLECHGELPAGWAEWAAPDSIHLGFFGNLGQHLPPDAFLSVLGDAISQSNESGARVRVSFVGRQNPAALEAIRNCASADQIKVWSQVPLPVAVAMMRGCRATLLFNGPEFERYLPGKLFYYMASGRPVLLYGAGGESQDLLDRFGLGFVIAQGNADALAAALRNLGSKPMTPARPPAAYLAAFSRDALAGAVIDRLEALRIHFSLPA